jgi:uncharacterized protein (DUF1684 family)
VTQEEDSPWWVNKGPIGPPIAHIAAWIGAFTCAALAYLLSSLGYLPRNLAVVVVAAGYCIPFAIAREMVAKRMRTFLAKEQKLSDEER